MAKVDVSNKNRYLAETVTQMCFAKKSVLKYLVRLTGKHLCRSFSLACTRENFFKKRLLQRCLPIKFIRAAFLKNTCEQFDNFDHHI